MKIRALFVPATLLLIADAAPAQPTGDLTGTIHRLDGSPVADAPIRARNAEAGVDARTRSSESGAFAFDDLPQGTYVLSVNMPCCQFLPYVDDAVAIAAGANATEIALTDFNINVEGDNPADVNGGLLRQQDVPDLPTPRMPDGRPDITGFWLFADDPYPEEPRIQEWVGPIVQERVESRFIDSPEAHCLPTDPPMSGGSSFAVKFVQRPDLVVVLLEDVAGFRQIFLDGREHPDDFDPTWMGHSIGHWEGDTLVVETVGFNDRGWTQIYPRTEMLRLEERYTRIDYGHLDVVLTYDDPGVFLEPWSLHMVWNLAPDLELMEYVCENNKWQDVGR